MTNMTKCAFCEGSFFYKRGEEIFCRKCRRQLMNEEVELEVFNSFVEEYGRINNDRNRTNFLHVD
jgi:hypothetical protein